MAEIAVLGLGVSLATLAIQGTSTAMQAHQMKRDKKKVKANSGLVPYGGVGAAQQSSTSLTPYSTAPAQYQYPLQPQAQPETKLHAYPDNKISAVSEGKLSPRPSFEGQPSWTTVQKVETTYYYQNGIPTSQDAKFEQLQHTHSYQSYTSPPQSPLPAPMYSTPPPSPLQSPPVMAQQQQPQQWPAVQVSGYVPGQGQISGFYTSAPQYMAPPPSYQQTVQTVARKRDRLRPWA